MDELFIVKQMSTVGKYGIEFDPMMCMYVCYRLQCNLWTHRVTGKCIEMAEQNFYCTPWKIYHKEWRIIVDVVDAESLDILADFT